MWCESTCFWFVILACVSAAGITVDVCVSVRERGVCWLFCSSFVS